MACITPYHVKHVRLGEIPVPCGRCPECKHRRVNSWVFRLLEEEKVSFSSHFLTLTYSTDTVPISPNGFMTLDRKAFPSFMKRLRKATWTQYVKIYGKKSGSARYKANPIRYYAAGEYGEQNDRPHYHAIIFNVTDPSLLAPAWTIDGNQLGRLHLGDVSGNSIAYCAKYIDKRKTIPKHKRDDREPEFSLMSKGLGKSYIENPATIRYHRGRPNELYLTKPGGHKIAMPRYYREKLFSEKERKAQVKAIKGIMDEIRATEDLAIARDGLDPVLYRDLHNREKIIRFNQINSKKRKL